MLKSILAFGLTRRAIILLSLLVFVGGGLVAFSKLNIEAYPNPAPVILEITAQAAGLSAEEMEKYYTVPMEIGLYPTPGVVNIRSTSFYGLSFVRVTFKYGVDFYFAYHAGIAQPSSRTSTCRAIRCHQFSNRALSVKSIAIRLSVRRISGLPTCGPCRIRSSPGAFSTIPGVVQINSWGGTTKQFDVDADPGSLKPIT